MFSHKSIAELKEGVFTESQICSLFRNDMCLVTTMMTDKEKAAWLSCKDVAEKLLGHPRYEDCKSIVKK